MQQQKWISLHLFYNNSLNFLIEKAIKPFIKSNDYIHSWFFIRYMENGQHIRLRVLIAETDTSIFIKNTQLHFNTFFKNFPSDKSIANPNNFPNNSIQFIDYQRETERYGGKKGILIAEPFFNYSSRTIFNFIDTETEYEQALLIGMVMNLYLAESDFENDTTLLFQSIFNNWLDFNLEYLDLSKAEIMEQFEAIYTAQSEMLTEIIQNILSKENDIEGFETWKKYCDETCDKLRNTEVTKPIPNILASYIHLNNNRLGISNFDESLMAYLILRTIN